MLTLLEAAEATGKSKPALLKAIKRGRISAQKSETGAWRIDPAELFRVYPRVYPVTTQVNDAGIPGVDRSAAQIELAVLRARVEVLAAERERERRQLEAVIEDLRAEREHWRRQASMLLSGPEARARRPGTWRRLWRALSGADEGGSG